MQQTLETEVLGQLTAAQFKSFKALFDSKLGVAKHGIKRCGLLGGLQ